MNVDGALDGLRVVIAAVLLYVGFGSKNERHATIALLVVGVLYIGVVAAWAGLRKSAELSLAR